MNGEFTLNNKPPRPKPARFEANSKTRQKLLFCGLACLPGQLDLFPTDGCEQAEDDHGAVSPVESQDGK